MSEGGVAGGFGTMSASGRSFGLSVRGVMVGREYSAGAESGNVSGRVSGTTITSTDGCVLSVTATTVVVSTIDVGVKGFLMV